MGPVHVGVRSKAQVHHNDDEPGLVGTLLSNRRSLKDRAVTRIHPNKAVDVIVNQPREADCFGTKQKTDVFPLRRGRFGNGFSVTERLIDFAARPEPMQ